ncbi:MAG: hypothetical protein HND43_10990 [Armatimonadetes bacterium]|nr:hypothetical protein [Chloroflexota bacterium]NOG39895.1 hypothetical protein [Armatimonadota bacterium]NOG66467.1 hypothetical protein [Chloroflexota bacterium]
MRRLLISILAILCALPGLPSSNPAHAEPSPTLYTCIFPDGPFAGQEILVRYDAPGAELSLVSNYTGETVQTLETGLNTPQFEVRGWSSDCRYMIASLGVWGEQSTAAWDVVENRRVGTIATKGHAYLDLVWVPTNDYRLLIESLSGAWLWHLPTNSQALLSAVSNEYGMNFASSSYAYSITGNRRQRSLYWDLIRSQVLAVTVDTSRTGVAAFDIYSGQEVAFYALNPTDDIASFLLFNNNQSILVYAFDFPYELPVSEGSQLRVFDRDTGNALFLSPEILAFNRPWPILSPSGRYLLIRTYALFIWDLQNPISEPPYRPLVTYEFPYGYTGAEFVDAFRITPDDKTIQAVAFWYGLDFTIWQWDLATGERFYAKKFLKTVCDDLSQLAAEEDVELVTWACGYR